MLPAQRHALLIEALRAEPTLSVEALCQRLGASPATVRRDLAKLARGGRVQRVRGGASALETTFAPYAQCQAPEAKRAIAAAAAELCQEGETIGVDAGSTTSFLGDHLADRALTVVTNSFPLASRLLAGRACRVVLTPGEVDPARGAVLDPFGSDFFAHYALHRLFLSVQALDEHGLYNDHTPVIRAEQRMIQMAREVVILADARKFVRRGNLRLCDWSAVSCVVTDAEIDDRTRAWLEQRVRLIVA